MNRKGRIIVVSIGYNVNRDTIKKNILSVQKQCCAKNFFHIIIDDGLSRNDISCLVPKFGHTKFIQNKFCRGAENLSIISNYIKQPDDIIVILPLQDWFIDKYSLQTIDTYHNLGNWITYGGSMINNDDKELEAIEEIPDVILKGKNYREQRYKPCTPISFKADLWKYINIDFFKNKDDEYMKSCYYIPLFYLLLDMTPFHRVKLLNEAVAVKNKNHVDLIYRDECESYYENIGNVESIEVVGNKPLIQELKDNTTVKKHDRFTLIPIVITEKDMIKYGGK